ncbi:MAG TPA: NAD(P)H-dependent oxidoreductase [Chthoniobacterales bacterium]
MSTPTLLVLNASPRFERSGSRKLAAEYVAAWKALHPEAAIVSRDLGVQPPPVVTEDWIAGAFTPPAQHSAQAKRAIAISDEYVNELIAAADILIATPVYNFNVPASLKLWIDQIVRPGRTFAIDETGYKGLIGGRKVTVLVTSGGDLRPGTPFGAFNFLEPYLRGLFAFLGITTVEFIYAVNQSNDAVRDAALSEALAATRELAAA